MYLTKADNKFTSSVDIQCFFLTSCLAHKFVTEHVEQFCYCWRAVGFLTSLSLQIELKSHV